MSKSMMNFDMFGNLLFGEPYDEVCLNHHVLVFFDLIMWSSVFHRLVEKLSLPDFSSWHALLWSALWLTLILKGRDMFLKRGKGRAFNIGKRLVLDMFNICTYNLHESVGYGFSW